MRCGCGCACGAGAVWMRWRGGGGGGARVPPHVEENDTVGVDDVEADAARADGHEQYPLARAIAEGREPLRALLCRVVAVETFEVDGEVQQQRLGVG